MTTNLIEGRYSIVVPSDTKEGYQVRVVALGDSTLTGEGLTSTDQIWLVRAIEKIASDGGPPTEVVIHARSGSRLEDIGRQVDFVPDERPDVIVLAVGTNDITSLTRLKALAGYRRRYARMLRALAGLAPSLVVTGVGDLSLSPRFLARPQLLPLRPVAKVASRYVDRQVMGAVRDVVKEGHAVGLIQPRQVDDEMTRGRQWYFSTDHFHPNHRGHEVWANHAEPTLATVLAEASTGASPRSAIRIIHTGAGFARIRTESAEQPHGTVVLIPDAPNVLEHYDEVFSRLSSMYRVIGLEMPDLGFSIAHRRFTGSLRSGADWILSVLEHEGADDVVIATSCINGLWAAKAAQIDRRVAGLVLGQTPSLRTLKEWGQQNIPWPLRIPVVGDLILRLQWRFVAGRWYDKTVSESEGRRRYLAIASTAAGTGARWKLASLYRAVQREYVDPLMDEYRRPGLEVEYWWGRADASYRDIGQYEVVRTDRSGHFPELDDVDKLETLINKIFARLA